MSEYIERKAALEFLYEVESIALWSEDEPETIFSVTRDADVIKYLENIPAADVRPAVRGRLIKPNPFGECSICGFLIDIRDNFNFCPNCGADMRGETK